MELTAYLLFEHDIAVRPAPVERDWMDATVERYAYRCLPLNIANTFGWELLLPSAFKAIWNGKPTLDGVNIYHQPGGKALAVSNFGYGVLTFHVLCVFRTEPSYDLYVQGPVNRPKDGIAPLTGIVETDWAPYTFTMNWKFTRPGHLVGFEAGEPFCNIFPVKRGDVEAFAPRVKRISENPELARQHELWHASRTNFVKASSEAPVKKTDEGWQKLYFRGVDAEGREAKDVDHRTRVKLKPFER